MPSFQSFEEFPHQQLFFDLKDKNNRKAKMKGGLGWMKNIWNDPRSLFNGNHFSSNIYIRDSQLNRPESVSLASLARQLCIARAKFCSYNP